MTDPVEDQDDIQDDLARKVEALVADHVARYRPTTLPPEQEQEFQEFMAQSPWVRGFQIAFGSSPNLDDPNYDYRGAWLAGLVPQAPGDHWPSRGPGGTWLKSPQHPTAWKEYFMATTGKDPDALGFTQVDYNQAMKDAMSQITKHPEKMPTKAETVEEVQVDPYLGVVGAGPIADINEGRDLTRGIQPTRRRVKEGRDLTIPRYVYPDSLVGGTGSDEADRGPDGVDNPQGAVADINSFAEQRRGALEDYLNGRQMPSPTYKFLNTIEETGKLPEA